MDIVYVIHQFDAENEDEISLRIGDPVVVLEKDDGFEDGWWQGRNKDGQQGLFPVNYTSNDPPSGSRTTTDDEYEEEQNYTESDSMTEDDRSLSTSSRCSSISHPISTPSVSTVHPLTDSFYSILTGPERRRITHGHLNDEEDDLDNDNNDDDDRVSSVMMPPILSPNITFVSKNLQKAVRAALLSTSLSPTPPEQWDTKQVADWLTQLGFDSVVDLFIEQEITGDILLELSLQSLKELEIDTFGKRFKIHSAILALREEIFRQDPFYLHPSKSCLSTTEDYHWMITGQGHPPQKHLYQRSSLDSDFASTDRSISYHHPSSYYPLDMPLHPTMENGKPHGILSVVPSSYDQPHQLLPHQPSPLLEEEEDQVTPDMEGWLYKQGDKYKTWNKRWFVLKGSNLFYFKSPKDVRMKGIINLRGYRIVCDEMISVGHYSFKAQHEKERTFFFYADTDLSMKAWIQALIKATIARDFNTPVVSSSTIPTVSLDMARRMNPRPPSTILYLNNHSAAAAAKPSRSPTSTISSPPLMISAFSDTTSIHTHITTSSSTSHNTRSISSATGSLLTESIDTNNSGLS